MLKTNYLLPRASDEQNEIISSFLAGYNVKIEAVAGSGKTTTLLLLATEAMTKFGCKTLILTYNRDLKEEINGKIIGLGLKNYCNVYTYHGYASRIYQANIFNDKLLHQYLNIIPSFKSEYDVILMDEVQDMNPDYNKLTRMVIKHADLLVVVGDRRQCINEYLEASSEYLINFRDHFNSGRPWKELMLRTSYRLTPYLANFVNCHILKEDIIVSGNLSSENIKPIYHYGVWNMEYLIKRMYKKYGANEVIILVPSIKSTAHPKSPIGNLLKKKHKEILFCVKEDEISDEATYNKIVVTSFNSMKGRERKCVILVGFDESYFEYFNKSWPKTNTSLPNIIYVAATRSSEMLILIQDSKKPPFRTVDKFLLPIHADIKGDEQEYRVPVDQDKILKREVIDLIKHRNLSDILSFLDFIVEEVINFPNSPLPYQNIVQFNGYYEDMKRYYGTLITLLAEHKLEGKTHLENKINRDKKNTLSDVYLKYNELFNLKNKTVKQWMELVVMLSALSDKYHFYKDQITNYDWVDEPFVLETSNRLISVIPKEGLFEQQYSATVYDKYFLVGTVDYVSETELWEFKCTSSLRDEHKIQCAAYISLHYLETGRLLPCKLFNVRTCELLVITVTNPEQFLQILLKK